MDKSKLKDGTAPGVIKPYGSQLVKFLPCGALNCSIVVKQPLANREQPLVCQLWDFESFAIHTFF